MNTKGKGSRSRQFTLGCVSGGENVKDVMNVMNVKNEMNVPNEMNVFHARGWVSLPFSLSFPFSFHLRRESKDNNTLTIINQQS